MKSFNDVMLALHPVSRSLNGRCRREEFVHFGSEKHLGRIAFYFLRQDSISKDSSYLELFISIVYSKKIIY